MCQDAEETIRRSGNGALAAMRDLLSLDLGRDSRDLKVSYGPTRVYKLTMSILYRTCAKTSAII